MNFISYKVILTIIIIILASCFRLSFNDNDIYYYKDKKKQRDDKRNLRS